MKQLPILLFFSVYLFSCSEPKNESESELDKTEEIQVLSTPINKTEPSPLLKKDSAINTSLETSLVTEPVKKVRNEKSETPNIDIDADKDEEKMAEKPIIGLGTKNSIHIEYNNLLSKYVSEHGDVDYENFRKEHTLLKTYINSLKVINYKTLSKKEQLAFLINLYNALTLDLILNNYPIKSIMDLPKPWDSPVITYQGKALTLNNIEHQLIRENFKEPRIHFACNCAAKSCPKLLNIAYEGNTLEQQLEMQTYSFLLTKSKNSISSNEIKISKIFEWYAGDFGNVKQYIKKYQPQISESTNITYLEYDWSLNKK